MSNQFLFFFLFISFLWIGLKHANAQGTLEVTIILKEKEPTNYTQIEGAQISFDDNIRGITNLNGTLTFEIDSTRYFGEKVKIEALHDNYLKGEIKENIGNDNEFFIELELPLFITGGVYNNTNSDPIPGAKVRIFDHHRRDKGVDFTDEDGIYRIKTDLTPSAKIEILVHHSDFKRPSIRGERVVKNDNVFNFFLTPLKREKGNTEVKENPLPKLQGTVERKKGNIPLPGIVLTDYKRSLRAVTNASGTYVIDNLPREWTTLSLRFETPKTGNFPIPRRSYFLTSPRKKEGNKVDFILKKNRIINHPKWQITLGLALAGLIADKIVAKQLDKSYQADPRNFSLHKTARCFQRSSWGLYTASGLSAALNLLLFDRLQVTARVQVGINP